MAIYFLQGYQDKTIFKYLAEHPKVKISLRTLKARLNQLKLGRRILMNEQLCKNWIPPFSWDCVNRVAIQVIL